MATTYIQRRFRDDAAKLPAMTSPLPSRTVRLLLEDWQAAGLTHLPRAEQGPGETEAVGESAALEVQPPDSPAGDLVVAESEDALKKRRRPQGRAARELALAEIAACVSGCTRCQELATTRTQTVFGVGNPEARVMFIGEAPGADEDAQGEPFVGRAGQLLNRIITACGWAREEIYICNILRCRPPGNRNPAPQEAANCREYLDGQIAIVDPEYIVCWGTCAAQNLLNQTETIGKMRRKWYQHGRAKVLCTYHPSYLLRNPEAKKPVWDDMLLLLAEMGLTPPKVGG
jgi:uracil-DNA glycosylase